MNSSPHSLTQTRTSSMRGMASIVAILFLPAGLTVAADDAKVQHFENRVRPLFVERCYKCHAGPTVKGGLRLDSREAVLRGGESGPAVVVGKPDESLLLQAVRHQNGLKMPPDGKLTETQIAALAEWIKAGAVWPKADAVAVAPIDAGERCHGHAAKSERTGEVAAALAACGFADARRRRTGLRLARSERPWARRFGDEGRPCGRRRLAREIRQAEHAAEASRGAIRDDHRVWPRRRIVPSTFEAMRRCRSCW